MAITVENLKPRGTINVDEFIRVAAGVVDPDDFESLHGVVGEFAALGTNKEFLVEHFNRELVKSDTRRLAQYLSPQSYVFAASPCGKIAVRCNIWVKPEGSSDKRALESRIFSYGLSHNHNFSFLTVGYFGPGYRSKIYEADPNKVEGYLGERVVLKFLEDTTLPLGKMMIYRRGLDVHTQLPPEGLSISLNLLMASNANAGVTQYYVDTETSRIIGFPEVNASSKRLTLLELAGCIGDWNTVDLLDSVVRTSPCFRTRVSAARAVIGLLPETEIEAYQDRLPFNPREIDVSAGEGGGGALVRKLA